VVPIEVLVTSVKMDSKAGRFFGASGVWRSAGGADVLGDAGSCECVAKSWMVGSVIVKTRPREASDMPPQEISSGAGTKTQESMSRHHAEAG